MPNSSTSFISGVLPVILGDGARLLPDGLAGSTWHLTPTAVLPSGAAWLTWTRSG